MEETKEKVVSVNIENYTGQKPIEVIVRKGCLLYTSDAADE